MRRPGFLVSGLRWGDCLSRVFLGTGVGNTMPPLTAPENDMEILRLTWLSLVHVGTQDLDAEVRID